MSPRLGPRQRPGLKQDLDKTESKADTGTRIKVETETKAKKQTP